MEKKLCYVFLEENFDEHFTNLSVYTDRHKALTKARNVIQEYINNWLDIEWNEEKIFEGQIKYMSNEISWNTSDWYLQWDWIVDVSVCQTVLDDNN